MVTSKLLLIPATGLAAVYGLVMAFAFRGFI
jgi:hypothetical protein